MVINMCLIEFNDGVVIELHDDCTFDVVGLSRTDVEFNTVCGMGDKVRVFNFINNRLGGALTA